jgi:hypothetical protein
MLMAMAALMGERPALIAAGRSSAPTSAMAGEGQRTQATSMMTTPMTQKATSARRASSAPAGTSLRRAPSLLEHLRHGHDDRDDGEDPQKLGKATVSELKTACTALTKLPVTTQASTSEATMQTIGVSFRIAMVTSTRR